MAPVPSMLLLAMSASAFRVRPKRGQKTNSSSAGYVVTLGDSYSSGTGIHSKISDYDEGGLFNNLCCREFDTTPGGRVASQQGKQHLMPACAGDEIPEIKEQFSALQANHPAEAANGWEGSTFMFTIGGNDIRSNDGSSWVNILVNCILSFYGDCHTAEGNQVANFPLVRSELVNFYTTVAQGASKASIRVWGYPRLLQRTWLGCLPVPGVSSAAADWADSMVDELNSNLRSAVAEVQGQSSGVDIQYVDVRDRMNIGACSLQSGKHVNAIVLNFESLLSPMTFHPTQAGYDRYYSALAPTLGASTLESHAADSTSPLWFPERIFKGWDVAGKGRLSMSDIHHMTAENADASVLTKLRELFANADANRDGFLNLPEFEGFLALAAKADHAL